MTMTVAATYSPGIRAAATRRGLTPAEYDAKKRAGLKWCRTCTEWRPLADYKPSTSTDDGVRPLCVRHYAPPRPFPHGTDRGYRLRCRCTNCRAANTQAQAKMRARWKNDPTAADRAGHGKPNTYRNYNCRCLPCKQATSAEMKTIRANRRKGRAA